jgi:cell division protein FtsW
MQKPQADRTLLITVLLLLGFGLIMITSIGVPKSIQLTAANILYPNCSDPQVDCYYLFKNHLIRMVIGLVVMLFVSKIPYRFWKKTSVFWYAAVLMLLFLVLIIGSQFTTFARSWLVLFNTSIQPVEYAKLALIFYLAHWMERKNQDIETFQFGFLPFCIVTGIILLPILLQPDLGGVLVVSAIAVCMYFAAGARIRHLALGAFIVFMTAILIFSTVDRVNSRVKAFMNQDENCREDYCWQTEQANIAVGSGGFWGKGLTQGVQKSYWLPQAADDFIFAASAEELGFIRIVFLVIAYAVIAYRGFYIASNAPDRFTSLTAVGITSWITLQAFMNIAINIGLMPVTGITLPFVSYGGSSMLSTLLAIGILLQISKYASQNAPGNGRRWDRRTYNAKYSYNK